MPPAYDLIIERGGSIVVETIEACDEDAAWRAGLMLHIEALMAVVCRDEHVPESTWLGVFLRVGAMFDRFDRLRFVPGVSLIPGADLSLFQQLNRALGARCQEPPAQAIRVCRLHARLVNG